METALDDLANVQQAARSAQTALSASQNENAEKDRRIKWLEDPLKAAEVQIQEGIKEKNAVEGVLREKMMTSEQEHSKAISALQSLMTTAETVAAEKLAELKASAEERVRVADTAFKKRLSELKDKHEKEISTMQKQMQDSEAKSAKRLADLEITFMNKMRTAEEASTKQMSAMKDTYENKIASMEFQQTENDNAFRRQLDDLEKQKNEEAKQHIFALTKEHSKEIAKLQKAMQSGHGNCNYS